MSRSILWYSTCFFIIINTCLLIKLNFNDLEIIKWSFFIFTSMINSIHLIGCLNFNNRFLVQTTHLTYFINFSFWFILLIIFI